MILVAAGDVWIVCFYIVPTPDPKVHAFLLTELRLSLPPLCTALGPESCSVGIEE